MSNETKKQQRPSGDYFRFSSRVKRVIARAKKANKWTRKEVVETAVLSFYK